VSFVSNNDDIITYTVNQTSNSSLYISIHNGEVTVKAPKHYSQEQIQKIVEEKKNWILKHLKEYIHDENIKKQKIKKEPIFILGKKYDIFIKYENTTTSTLNLLDKYVEIVLPTKYVDLNKTKIINATISKMYLSIAKAELENIMEDARHQLGFAPEDFRIKNLDNNMLAKCSNGIITINPAIMQYSREIVRFIIIHQFCHLKYKNHTKNFYNLMEKYIFNYDEIAKQVNSLNF